MSEKHYTGEKLTTNKRHDESAMAHHYICESPFAVQSVTLATLFSYTKSSSLYISGPLPSLQLINIKTHNT
jgi:hypothetical protein